jgi:DNA-binding transcriptional ArsR family regulator
VSRHLAMLRDAGILNAEKKGKSVFYFVSYSALVGFLRSIADAIEACCPNDISDKKETRNERKR